MDVTFDPAKDAANMAKHGVSLAEAGRLEWGTAKVWVDDRRDFGEMRLAGLGYIGARLYRVAFVERDGVHRIISLRKANPREYMRYAKT